MIGFLDSGVGGLTVLESVQELMPELSTVYIGDTAFSPYGNKSHDEIVGLAWRLTEDLFKRGCPLVIFACNSASASALAEIQQQKLAVWPGKRVLGIIRPTVEFFADQGFERVLILGTDATVNSHTYKKEFTKVAPEIAVTEFACPTWGPMVENGLAGTEEGRAEVFRTLEELSDANYDAVLLACTHYPYLKSDIETFFENKIPVFNQGPIIADSLKSYLNRHPEIDKDIKKTSGREYYATGDPAVATQVSDTVFKKHVEFDGLA